MKNYTKYIYKESLHLSTIVVMAFFSTICAQQNPAENLVGTWQFDDTNSFATMDTISKVKLDSLPELKAQILSSYSGRSFSFYPDGNCSLKMANGQSFPYDWALTEDSVLVLTDPEGNSGQEMIRVLTNNRLVLVPKVEGKTRNIIEEQHFIKQQ